MKRTITINPEDVEDLKKLDKKLSRAIRILIDKWRKDGQRTY